jgi:hypothetical protein
MSMGRQRNLCSRVFFEVSRFRVSINRVLFRGMLLVCGFLPSLYRLGKPGMEVGESRRALSTRVE